MLIACRAVASFDNWGARLIFIYSYSHTIKKSISKEINSAENECINISPPPQISSLLYDPDLESVQLFINGAATAVQNKQNGGKVVEHEGNCPMQCN